jgi:hypothetical protein
LRLLVCASVTFLLYLRIILFGPSKRLKRGFLHNPQVRNNPSFIVASVAFMASSTSATLKEQLAFAAPLGRIGSLNSASLVGRPGMFQACLLERPTTQPMQAESRSERGWFHVPYLLWL